MAVEFLTFAATHKVRKILTQLHSLNLMHNYCIFALRTISSMLHVRARMHECIMAGPPMVVSFSAEGRCRMEDRVLQQGSTLGCSRHEEWVQDPRRGAFCGRPLWPSTLVLVGT